MYKKNIASLGELMNRLQNFLCVTTPAAPLSIGPLAMALGSDCEPGQSKTSHSTDG